MFKDTLRACSFGSECAAVSGATRPKALPSCARLPLFCRRLAPFVRCCSGPRHISANWRRRLQNGTVSMWFHYVLNTAAQRKAGFPALKQCLSSRLTAWVSLIAKLTRKCEEGTSRLTATVMHPFSWMHHRRGQSTGALLAFSFAKHPPGGGSAAEWRCRQRLTVAPDETVILLHPPLHVVGVSIAMERYRQQNDSLVNG